MSIRRERSWLALVGKAMAAGLVGGCVGLASTDVPPSSEGFASPRPSRDEVSPSASASHETGPLAEAGWFSLTTIFPDQDSLAGFDLDVGTLDGNFAGTVSKRYGPLRPSATFAGSLPVAAGPFGDTVLVAFWNGKRSELQAVSVRTGEARVIARPDYVIHAVTRDPRSGSTFLVARDPLSKAEQGIYRLTEGSVEPQLLVKREEAIRPTATAQIWTRLWVTPDGSRLVVLDCPGDCFASVYGLGGVAVSRNARIPGGRDVVGVTNDAAFGIFGCEPPCAASSYDLTNGQSTDVGDFCSAAVLVSIAGRASFVADAPVADDCRGRSYRLRQLDLATGVDAPPLTLPTRERQLVSMDGTQGAAPPEGWVVLGPSGRLVGTGAEAATPPALVHLRDGAVVTLRVLRPATQ